jgi:hypothetical protein
MMGCSMGRLAISAAAPQNAWTVGGAAPPYRFTAEAETVRILTLMRKVCYGTVANLRLYCGALKAARHTKCGQ